MDRVKGVAKGGWHPPGKESWRGDFKGINQVAGWVGKGKSSDALQNAQEHHSRPLATLKDPDAFGPPPKNVNYHGGAAVPNAITPDTRGLGAPINLDDIRAKEEADREAQAAKEAQEALPPPSGPYRVDTTGLSTTNLPKPPVRRFGQDASSNSNEPKKPKPSLPPRLPPRQNSGTPNQLSPPPSYESATTQVPSQKSYLNQGALNRLASAGVSVPDLGIGGGSQSTNPWRDRQTPVGDPTAPESPSHRTMGMNELQGRFSKMSSSTPPESPSAGTTFAQKQAALKTANSFRNDPSSISLSDARTAASTAKNFRERHGDQVAAGWQSANGLNSKYGISNKINGYASNATTSSSRGVPSPPASPLGQASFVTEAKMKAPPPPPPPKKRMNNSNATAPPEIPLSSKPRP